MVRPQFYRSEATGSLPPDVRDCLIGITTITDDEGWLLWRPAEIAAVLYPFAPARRRLRDLERRAQRLIDAGLVEVHDCGCAFLPTLKEHHGIKGGNQTRGVWGWHERHKSVQVRTDTDEYVSYTSSSSGSDSEKGAASSSSRARDGQEATRDCDWCHTAFGQHTPMCPQAPHLEPVAS